MCTPSSASRCRAMTPTAVRARRFPCALARSSTSRRSRRSYLSPADRSACPGRGRVTAARRAPGSSSSGVRLHAHRVLPVGPVAVANEEGDRTAKRLAMAHAGQNLRSVLFDDHAPAAAVAAVAGARDRSRSLRLKGARPAGTPSTIATSARPCDSPAVRNRNIGPAFYRSFCRHFFHTRGSPQDSRRTISCSARPP